MAHSLLGALSPAAFLRRHWQKQPLFVNNAIADCGAWLSRRLMFEWATRDDVQSRLVMHTRGRWSLQHGPFRRAQLTRLPARGWSLLVQGVEQLHREGAALMQRFAFIPHARLDDLMVSYAPPGGGVGPHFDSYDVFLLQGPGTRRWRVSAQRDRELVANAPLRILRRFRPAHEWLSRPGDLLYLPPHHAHEGVALDACFTLSVGFRAPGHQELASKFLDFLQDDIDFKGMYQDRGLRVTPHPGEVPPQMLREFTRVLRQLRWGAPQVRRFAGCYLTEPKAHVVFLAQRAPAITAFARRLARQGVRLAPGSRMLMAGNEVFVNGERHLLPARDRAALAHFADRRELPGPLAATLGPSTTRLMRTWYGAGYIEFDSP